jgi:nicotinamide riboside kinase
MNEDGISGLAAHGALCIAIVGAESTGKTALAAALAARLGEGGQRRVTWVPELLREWCERAGRTPRADEQAAIMDGQHRRIEAAAATHDLVVCDTTGLMTAVYSDIVFCDRGLDATATAWHRCVALTLLTAIDLPWVADGLQRDGPQARAPVDARLRELLREHRLPFETVDGQGPARLARALALVAPLLARPAPQPLTAPRGSRAAGRAPG